MDGHVNEFLRLTTNRDADAYTREAAASLIRDVGGNVNMAVQAFAQDPSEFLQMEFVLRSSAELTSRGRTGSTPPQRAPGNTPPRRGRGSSTSRARGNTPPRGRMPAGPSLQQALPQDDLEMVNGLLRNHRSVGHPLNLPPLACSPFVQDAMVHTWCIRY